MLRVNRGLSIGVSHSEGLADFQRVPRQTHLENPGKNGSQAHIIYASGRRLGWG